MTQSERLKDLMDRAREIRLAYGRGEISHEERMRQLHELRRPKTRMARFLNAVFGI